MLIKALPNEPTWPTMSLANAWPLTLTMIWLRNVWSQWVSTTRQHWCSKLNMISDGKIANWQLQLDQNVIDKMQLNLTVHGWRPASPQYPTSHKRYGAAPDLLMTKVVGCIKKSQESEGYGGLPGLAYPGKLLWCGCPIGTPICWQSSHLKVCLLN